MDRKNLAGLYFDGQCFICQKKFGKRFQFHHLWYEKNEKKWNDFSNADDYWEYVQVKIKENPKRFRLLCRMCHHRIDKPKGGLSRMKKDKVVRLFIVTLETIKS